MSSLTQRPNARRPKVGDVDEALDWETMSILRVPQSLVPDVDNFIEHGRQLDHDAGPSTAPRMAIRFQQNQKCGQLKIGERTVGFKVQDLPCIIEVAKTTDNKDVFKVADISQVINCTETPEVPDIGIVLDGDRNDREVAASIARREKLTSFPHGITAPMKNVKKRRFRKTKKKKYMDAPQVEQELKRLLRLDIEAESMTWEVVSESSKLQRQPKIKEEPKEIPATSI